ncbi:O-antigen ligase family protein [Clostridium sp. 1001275B_160808_H3]|uniref:O-antigen ligase family protein n=1 Tax=Clostridium sp. 1001275B_160808_H3 TaxID=2787110 RepID=UPI00189A8141|nr:O-antigen ligase family protein [Clostridium sp. 1001275B_160808_H3]
MNDKKQYFKWLLISIFVAVCALASVKAVGIKDGFTFTLSLIITLYILFNAKKNIKRCMYLFIMSMPILVTARKLLYLDLFIIKLNFESIIILYLFICNYKQIKLKIVELFERNKKLFYFIILLCFSSYISCMFSTNFILSLELTTTSILVPVLLAVLALSVFNKEDIKRIVYSLIISVNFSCLYGIVQLLGIGLSIDAIKSSREMITFGYHNVNIFVNVVLMVFPLLLNEILYKKNTIKENVFLILSAILQMGSTFITFSRGAWLSLGLVVVLILFSKKYRYVFMAIVIAGGLMSPFVLPKIMGRGDSSSHFLQNTSNTARVLSIIASKDIMLDNIFGVGYGNFNENYRLNADDAYMSIDYEVRKNMVTPLYTMEHAHNLFLNVGVELGIFALIAILGIFIIQIRKSISNYGESRGIFVSLILFIFIGVTTGIQLNHKGVVTNTYILWLLFAMILLIDKNDDKLPSTK